MFKTKLLLALLGAATVAGGVSVSFSTSTVETNDQASVEYVEVDKDVKLSNYSVALDTAAVKIDNENYDVVDGSPVTIVFTYDVESTKECALNIQYRFNFQTVSDIYYVDEVTLENYDGNIINGSAYNNTRINSVLYRNWALFPAISHDLEVGNSTITENLTIYFTVSKDASREQRKSMLDKVGSFVSNVSVTILDATAE